MSVMCSAEEGKIVSSESRSWVVGYGDGCREGEI